jgi:hypothetical protein
MSQLERNVKTVTQKAKDETNDEENSFDRENQLGTSSIEKDLLEDQESLFDKTFPGKQTFINEKWDKHLFIDGKVDEIRDNIVYVSCLMDEENQLFKEKVFPKELTSHIKELEENSYLRVKISFKAGSMKYDIYDGKGLNINKEAFEAEDLWDSLEDFELDEPA